MEILLSEQAMLDIEKLGLTKEEALDAAVLPDYIEELPDGQKEFLKHSGEKMLKLTVLLKEQRQVLVLKAEWMVGFRK